MEFFFSLVVFLSVASFPHCIATKSHCNRRQRKTDSNDFGQCDIDDTSHQVLGDNLGEIPSDKVPLHTITKKYITLPVDHFDENNKEKFHLRFFINNMFAKKRNAPIYLTIGDVDPVGDEVLGRNHIFKLARATRGIIVYTDIRYYGISKTSDKLEPPTDLTYLNTKQVLEDLKKLLERFKHVFQSSKIILHGQYYGGRLAVWMRQKYPELVDAAFVVSAQLKFHVDSKKYTKNKLDHHLEHLDKTCVNGVRAAFSHMIELIKDKRINELHDFTHACPDVDLKNKINQQYMFYMYADSFLVAYRLGIDEMISHCDNFISNHEVPGNGTKLMKKKAAPKFLHPNIFKQEESECGFYDFAEAMDVIKTSTSKIIQNHKYYLYQMCHEFGSFDTSTYLPEPFNLLFPLEFSIKICQTLFDYLFDNNAIDKNVERTNDLYNGLKPNVTNVLFIVGELDPWKESSICKTASDYNRVIVVKDKGSGMDINEESSIMNLVADDIRMTLVSWLELYEDEDVIFT